MKSSILAKTITISGITIGFTFYGLSLFIILLFVYWIVAVFDIATRFIVEKRKSNIKSSHFGEGILKRANKTLIVILMYTIFAHVKYEFFQEACDGFCNAMGVVPITIMALFLLEEMISLIENAIELDSGQNKVLKALRAILGLGLKKGLKFTKTKMENEINKR